MCNGILDITLCKKPITDQSAQMPLLFGCNKVRFSSVKAHIINVTLTVYYILLFVPCNRRFVGNSLNLGKLKKDTAIRDSTNLS